METKQRSQVKKKVTFVHNQYNSPLGLYSTEEVAETLQRHTRLLSNGAVGVDFSLLSAPHLNKSEVYKMLSEEEPQLYRNVHQQQVMTTSSTTSEVKRVAWPPAPASNIFANETSEFQKYGNESGKIVMPIQQQDAYIPVKQQEPFLFHQQGQQQYNQLVSQVSPKNEPVNPFRQPEQQQFYSQDEEEEQIPPKVPPRVYPKPIVRSISDALEPFTSKGGNQVGHRSDTTQLTKSATLESPGPRRRIVRMSSRGTAEPFASNELVGDRPLIAKPAPPPGLVLGRAIRKEAPFLKETQHVRSESFFKRGTTPVRMLGDMVWPPKGTTDNKLPAQSPGTVRRQQKNYRDFFSQNQLPPNFPTYRAPPGTQHFGLEEGENATPM